MLVPTVAITGVDGELDEAHALFHEAPGHQTLGGIGAGIFVRRVETIKLFGGFGFTGQVRHLGHLHLHTIGEFVILNGGFDGTGVGQAGFEIAVDLVQEA